MNNNKRYGSNTSASDIGDILNTDQDSIIDIRRRNDSEAQSEVLSNTDLDDEED